MSDPTPEQLQQEFIDSEERTSEHLRTPLKTKEERLIICSSCEFKGEMFGLASCNECNCLLGFKIPLLTSTCPKGKW